MKALRECIVTEAGYTFLSLDADQIELRVIALLSQDPQMLEDLRTGDLHMATAIRMLGWTEDEEVMKKRRYDAKQANFALLYGADEEKLAEMLGCDIDQATAFMEEHKETYPVLYQWIAERIKEAKERGYTVNMFGRIRPLPELSSGTIRSREKAEREVCNTIVQGSAVDLTKLAMLYCRRLFPSKVRLVLQVHDEILWEVPDSQLLHTVEQCKELPLAFPDYPFSLSLGKCYGQLEKVEK